MPRPVSPEVLSLFREGFDCWNRDELDEMTRMYADDAVFDVSAVFADVEPKRGRPGRAGDRARAART